MALLKVAVAGHPVLRQVAKKIPEKEIRTERIQTLIADMAETMVEYDGRGLAAPQVHESLQLVVMLWDFDPKEKTSLRVLINPVLKPLTETTLSFWEGCLSLPGLRGKVARPNKISVEALDQDGEKVSFVAEDFCATVIQHECDHLQGVLYVDRIKDFRDFAFNREFQRFIAPQENLRDEELEEEG